jgi:hypothetical protein
MGSPGGLGGARQLADEFAQIWLHRLGIPARARVDVHGIASALGLEVVPAPIKHDGQLALGSPARILVQDGQPLARQRFTVAHELAHWAVHTGRTAEIGLDQAFHSEEMLCNSVAGALLMPLPWLREALPVAAHSQELKMVRELARQANVSLGAAVIRLRDAFGWRKTLLHWSRVEGEWVFDGEAGVYPREQGAIVPSSNVVYTLNEVRNSSHGIQRCTLSLRIFRAERQVAAEVLPLRRGAVVLVDAPDPSSP